ncbi:MAG TPA: hypothetical protein VFE10_00130 [Phenylobacterium sp.]|nr:hypothetical protein [Phenylobacterium sp.]
MAPIPAAPTLKDRPRPSSFVQHSAAAVALAPAAMHALLLAQEQLDTHASVLARTPTVIAVDQLITQMADATAVAAPAADASLTLRRLEAARQQLAQA